MDDDGTKSGMTVDNLRGLHERTPTAKYIVTGKYLYRHALGICRDAGLSDVLRVVMDPDPYHGKYEWSLSAEPPEGPRAKRS